MLPNWFNDYRKFIEENIEKYLDLYFDNKTSKPLEELKKIIKYSLEWWKKIRAILALEFFIVLSWKNIEDLKLECKKWEIPDILKFCIAIESTHAYSLIHDDLPCMDNDTLRRWKPTVWHKFWEYKWVLAWDLLNSFSFEILSEITNPKISQKLTKLLSNSVWFYGMLWWQIEDLYFEEHFNELNLDILENLHNKKTWALIKSSILWWILLSWKEELISNYSIFWEKLWLAFQVKDDLLDVEWTSEETGKNIRWEDKGYVYFLWIKKSKEKLSELIKECRDLIKNLSSKKIDFIVDYIENRKK